MRWEHVSATAYFMNLASGQPALLLLQCPLQPMQCPQQYLLPLIYPRYANPASTNEQYAPSGGHV
jgi:hypothetical protein